MTKIYTLLFCFFINVLVANSQYNDSTNYFISYTTTGVINKTNQSSSNVLTNALRFGVKRKDITLNNSAAYVYGFQQKKLTNNDFVNTLDFNLYKTFEHFYYWGLANYEKSFSLNINNRIQAGLGVAYNFLDKKNAFLNVSNGLLFESSNLKISDTSNLAYNTFRNSFRVRYRFASAKSLVVLDGMFFLQNALRSNQDYILKNNTNLSFKLNEWLSLTTAAGFNRINRTNRENLLITFGLRAETYF